MAKQASTLQRQQKRVFTVREANATLPLVRAIVADLIDLSRDVSERRERFAALMRGGEKGRHGPYREELAHVEQELENDSQRVLAYVEELRELGAEPKSVTEGLVDFPAMLDGRLVYLCWKVGETEIGYWHEVEAGFRGRQPVGDLWE